MEAAVGSAALVLPESRAGLRPGRPTRRRLLPTLRARLARAIAGASDRLAAVGALPLVSRPRRGRRARCTARVLRAGDARRSRRFPLLASTAHRA